MHIGFLIIIISAVMMTEIRVGQTACLGKKALSIDFNNDYNHTLSLFLCTGSTGDTNFEAESICVEECYYFCGRKQPFQCFDKTGAGTETWCCCGKNVA